MLPAHIVSVKASQDLIHTINRCPDDDRLACLASVIAVFTNSHCPDLNLELRLAQHALDKTASMHCTEIY